MFGFLRDSFDCCRRERCGELENTYCIAEKNVRIVSMYEAVHRLCADYQTKESPDFVVAIAQTDIDYEREKSAEEDRLEQIPVRSFSDDYLETLAVYRKIAEQMLTCDTILFHGSVIAVDGVGYLFTAKSGTGKSTHTRLWREQFGDRAIMINDDKPLLKLEDTGVRVFGTPWDGKHRLSTNIAVPLKAIAILERSAENHIERIAKKEAYSMLLQQTYRPKDGEKMLTVLELLDKLASKMELYRLSCNMEKEAAIVAYEGMRG